MVTGGATFTGSLIVSGTGSTASGSASQSTTLDESTVIAVAVSVGILLLLVLAVGVYYMKCRRGPSDKSAVSVGDSIEVLYKNEINHFEDINPYRVSVQDRDSRSSQSSAISKKSINSIV